MGTLSENHLVEKSKALVWAKFKDYGAGELKILDTYLSRINARDPDSSFVTFTKKEYADLMGLDADIRTDQLKGYTSGLLSNVVTLDLPGKGYVQYPLFSEARCVQDEDSGRVTISIDCNHKLKQVFFDIANDGYVRYQLKNVINMRSQYSIKLYTMLKDRPFGWEVGIEELRKNLGATMPTYDEFKRFNSLILKKSIEEINEITDIIVNMETIRKGRPIVAVKFTVKSKKNFLLADGKDAPGQMAMEEFMESGDPEIYDPDDPLALPASVLPDNFTREQVQMLVTLANEYVPYTVANFEEKKMWIADYLLQKTQLMNATPEVRAPFAWMRKAVAENW